MLGKLPVPGLPAIWITVGQGPTALAESAGWVVWTFLFSTILSPSLWETARYRLKYCLKGPLNPKQPTNRLETASNENTGGGGLQLVFGRPTLALSSALVPQILSCLVSVENLSL